APGHAPATASLRFGHRGGGTGDVALGLGKAAPLRGRLLGPRGKPVADARVEVIRVGDATHEPILGAPDSSRPPAGAAPVPGPDGVFALPALRGAPNVWVRVRADGHALATFRCSTAAHRHGDEVEDFHLPEARTLEVRVCDAETDRPLARVPLTVVTERPHSH